MKLSLCDFDRTLYLCNRRRVIVCLHRRDWLFGSRVLFEMCVECVGLSVECDCFVVRIVNLKQLW